MFAKTNSSFYYTLLASFGINIALFLLAVHQFDTFAFIKWDVIHYLNIKHNGYSFEPCANVNVAFFPLFPYLSKLLNLSILYICILNLLFFYLSLFLLKRFANISNQLILLFALFPSTFFFYIPYSEALFFFASTLLLLGVYQKKSSLLYLSVFLLGLTRPVISIIIAAFLVLTIWNILEKKPFSEYKRYVIAIVVAILSILTVAIIQYLQTGTWFAMFKSQLCWDHYFQLKPFFGTSWGSTLIQRWDNVSAALGFSSLTILLFKFFDTLKISKGKIFDQSFLSNDVQRISFLYLAGISMSIWLFQNNWHSLNRYIWCSPFVLLLISSFINTTKKTKIIALIIFFCWLIPVGGAQHIQVLLQLIGISVYILTLFYINQAETNKKTVVYYLIFILVCAVSLYYQWTFLTMFLNNKWVA